MSVSDSDINRIIKLAHLSLDADTSAKLGGQIKEILGHMAALNDAPVDYSHDAQSDAPTPTRTDTVNTSFGNCFGVNSHYQEGPFYVVPKIAGSTES